MDASKPLLAELPPPSEAPRVHLLSMESEVELPPRAAALAHSAKRTGWPLTFVGQGCGGGAFTLRYKMRAYLDALQALPDDDLAVLVDSRDVLALRSPVAFADAFARCTAHPHQLLVSMEALCGGGFDPPPPPAVHRGNGVILRQYWAAHAKGSGAPPPFRQYVNSGLVAGRAAPLRRWLAWALGTEPQFHSPIGWVSLRLSSNSRMSSVLAPGLRSNCSVAPVNHSFSGPFTRR